MPAPTKMDCDSHQRLTGHIGQSRNTPEPWFDPETDNVTAFIGARWGQKFKRVFDLGSDVGAMKMYNALHTISEQYRNTYGHGGFDKAGATVAFQVPGIGAVPAILSDLRDSPHFDFVPTAEKDFHSISETFDALDRWLAEGSMANAWTWITGGMDLRYDPPFRRLVEAAEEENDFRGLMEYLSDEHDRAANMDW